MPWREIGPRLRSAVWHADLASLPRWKATIVRATRIAWAASRDLYSGQLTLHAMSLVYTTLLSLVPLLAVSFSVLKAFGDESMARPLLLKFLAPLGPKSAELTDQIIGSVRNMNVGLLSSVGVALLVFTVLSLIQKIEHAFAFTWHISHSRHFTRRLGDYLSVILIGPVLMFGAFGLTASVMATRVVNKLLQIEPVNALAHFAGQVVPYLLVIAAFTFFYIFVPDTKVRLSSALTGALFAGILWETVGRVFSSFVVTSARYAALYSGFAILLIFMIWLYVSWLLLLLGACVAFYHQHPEYLGIDRLDLRLSGRLREKLALLAVYLIGQRFYRHEPPWTEEALAREMGLPTDLLTGVLEDLARKRIVAQSGDKQVVFLPARPFESVRLVEVLEAVRTAEESPFLSSERLALLPEVEQVQRRISAAVDEALADGSVRDLVLGEAAAPGPASGVET